MNDKELIKCRHGKGMFPCSICEREDQVINLLAKNLELSAHIERLRGAESCRNCPDEGFTVIENWNTGEPEQEQCEFCYTVTNSLFNVRNSTPKQSLAQHDSEVIDEFKRYVLNGLTSMQIIESDFDLYAKKLRSK